MRKIFLLCILVWAAAMPMGAQCQQQRLSEHVYFLASDSLRGRAAGSVDARRAADYIEEQFMSIGLRPFLGSSYRHTFKLNGGTVEAVSAAAMGSAGASYCNLVALIEGSDPVLKDEYIVIGAHYDHLGVRNDQVYNGADDNASGTAAVIEVARELMAHRSKLQRSVILCAFDAEEIGLCGSSALAAKLESMGLINRVKLMMSLDMVGWYRQSGYLSFSGVGMMRDCSDLLRQEADKLSLNIHTTGFESSPFTATDTEPFAKRGIPALAVTTGLKSPYHKPEDDADLIDYEGLSLVVSHIANVVFRMASAAETLRPSGKVAYKHRQSKPVFEMGLYGGLHEGNLQYADEAPFAGKVSFGPQAGLFMQLNINKRWAVRLGAEYNRIKLLYPSAADPFKSTRILQQSLEVPLTLQLSLGYFYLGAGAVGGYLFSLDEPDYPISLSTHDHPYTLGWCWNFGVRMGRVTLGGDLRYQIGTLVPAVAGSGSEARKFAYNISLGYFLF